MLIAFYVLTPGFVQASEISSSPMLSSDTLTEVSADENLDLDTPIDTSLVDSLNNAIAKKKKESNFKSEVTYHADDSIMIDNINNKAILWGNAWVKYEDIQLDAEFLEIDFAKNEVFAKGLPDSTGKIVDTPIFQEKGKEYKSGEMVYNFNTKKGLIKKITTQEASGYIHGETIKMASEDVFYIRNGKYTTCNNETPHYHVQAQKLKIINNDKIVTGPAYLAIENVPTFLAVPFGYFPNQDERTSGVLIPTIGSSATKGFNLMDGGYYFGISDKFDFQVTGDVYTNGSWAGRALARYNTRYKRNGNLMFNYTNSNTGERDTQEFEQKKSYFVTWSHTQDPKAKPNSDFRATVRMGSPDYFENDLNTNSSAYLRNEFSSNITYTQRFARSPFSVNLNASHNQNKSDSSISFTLPELQVNMSRVYPFKRKVKIGKDRWYEKIGVNYSGNAKNKFEMNSYQLFEDPENLDSNFVSTPVELNYGAKQTVNINTNMKVGHLTFSPGIRYDETWYFRSVTQTWIPPTDSTMNGTVRMDTTNGFNRYGNLDLNASLNTKLFGIYAFRGERLKAIRHTMTPSVSINYRPDLSTLHPEYFGTVQTDTSGTTKDYNVFMQEQAALGYGSPNGAESGRVGLGLQNIIEMKRKKRNDTTDTYSNVNIIDRWNFNTSYDMLADSFQWAPLTMSINGSIGRFILLNVNTASDFYGVKKDPETDTYSRSKQFNYNLTGKPLRLTRLTASAGLNLSGKSLSNQKDQATVAQLNNAEDINTIYQEQQYIDFNIPWDLKVNYVFTYTKPLNEENLVNSLTFSGSVNVTPGWKVRMSSSYDFEQQKLGFTNIDVYRDLHCWQIDLNVNPFGERKSFRINLKVKQGFLQDLKLSKNSRWFDG